MKTYTTSGTGAGQSLSGIQTEKIPVYGSLTEAEADLSNLEENQIIATDDTGNELAQPVDVVEEDNMHAVTSNAVAESLSYSTTEQKTGGYWIDGKPIYRKVVSSKLPNNTTKTIAHSISNISQITKLSGLLNINSNNTLFVALGLEDSNDKYTYYTVDKTNIVAYTNWDGSSTTCYFVIEYTKTTD